MNQRIIPGPSIGQRSRKQVHLVLWFQCTKKPVNLYTKLKLCEGKIKLVHLNYIKII